MSTAVRTAARIPGELLDSLAGDRAGESHPTVWSEWLEANGLPDPSAEEWRYTPLDEMAEALFASRPAGSPGIDPATFDAVAPRHGGVRLVFVDGRFSEELSDSPASADLEEPLPPGARVGELCGLQGPHAADAAELLGRWALPQGEDLAPNDGFRALNALGGGDTAVVSISPGVAVGSPIHILHLRSAAAGDDPPTLSQPRTLIDVGSGASCRVIETHLSMGAGFTNATTRIRVGVDGHLHHIRVQDEHHAAHHMGDTVVETHRGAHLESIAVNLGASRSRCGIDLALCGEHATADLSGLSLLSADQRCDTVLGVDHRVPNCTSSQDFRSIVDDRARSSFCGHVLVDHGAAGTDSSQSNRNLLLSRRAQADTRPWLEILADDVKCTHGATVGRIDEDARFYMLSRGIPAEKAESMLIGAFAAEVIDDVEPPALRDTLYARIDELDQGAHS